MKLHTPYVLSSSKPRGGVTLPSSSFHDTSVFNAGGVLIQSYSVAHMLVSVMAFS